MDPWTRLFGGRVYQIGRRVYLHQIDKTGFPAIFRRVYDIRGRVYLHQKPRKSPKYTQMSMALSQLHKYIKIYIKTQNGGRYLHLGAIRNTSNTWAPNVSQPSRILFQSSKCLSHSNLAFRNSLGMVSASSSWLKGGWSSLRHLNWPDATCHFFNVSS